MYKIAEISEEIFQKRLKSLNDVINVQYSDGNWNYDPYMHGMANGLCVAENIMKDDCDRPFLEAPKKWLCDKIANEILGIKVMSLKDLLTHPFSKTAMSLGQLLESTSKKSVKYKKGCTATIDKNMPKSGRWNFSVSCIEKWSKGPYLVRIRLLKSGRKTTGFLGRQIEVSCNCNAWRYNGADYNAQNKNYGERQYSNGDTPEVRDPKKKYLICKHVATCVPLIKEFTIPKAFK